MELQGKKICFLGDSITAGSGISSMDKIYWNLLAEREGCISYGHGVGATRIASQKSYGLDNIVKAPNSDNNNEYFVTRVPDMVEDADAIVVFGGTNDYGHGDATLGSMADRTPETFYGAMHHLCITLRAKYPTAPIVIMTPLHRCRENQPYNSLGIRNMTNLSGYVAIIKEVAAYYNLPVLDLYAIPDFEPENEENRLMYMRDGLHPNDLGHEILYKYLSAFLKAL